MGRIRSFIAHWQDGLIWIPLALLLLIAATALLPLFDPRAGIDGLGFLQGYAALLVKGGLITFSAWLCKRTYTIDWDAADEQTLVNNSGKGAWIPLVVDRAEWAMWLLLWAWIFSN